MNLSDRPFFVQRTLVGSLYCVPLTFIPVHPDPERMFVGTPSHQQQAPRAEDEQFGAISDPSKHGSASA